MLGTKGGNKMKSVNKIIIIAKMCISTQKYGNKASQKILLEQNLNLCKYKYSRTCPCGHLRLAPTCHMRHIVCLLTRPYVMSIPYTKITKKYSLYIYYLLPMLCTSEGLPPAESASKSSFLDQKRPFKYYYMYAMSCTGLGGLK